MYSENWGIFWTALNPTLGTGIFYNPASSFSDTNAFLAIQNIDKNPATQTGGQLTVSRRIYLEFIKLICTASPAAAASMHAALKIDPVLSRYSSGGTQLTRNSPVAESPATPAATIFAGAINLAAASGKAAVLDREVVRFAAPKIGDEYLFSFGSDSKNVSEQLDTANVSKFTSIMTPVIQAWQSTLTLHLWFPSATIGSSSSSGGPSFEVVVGWRER